MEERPELFTKKLKPWLHLMDEGHTATGYVVEGDDKVYEFEELKLPDEGVGTYERVPILGGIDYDENGKIVYRKE